MAGRVVVVTGGCRSGKSRFAQEYVETHAERRVFLATSPVLDEEMLSRIQRHQAERAGRCWSTVEEELDLAQAIARVPSGDGLVVDCLTLWAGNLLHHYGESGYDEDRAAESAGELALACRAREGLTVMVTNEVGWGIVPDNALARRFRDVAGRINQIVAGRADEVHLMVCGIATRIR